jgi:hypothetical protein
MTQVIYQVEIVGWKEKYYFGKEGVAKSLVKNTSPMDTKNTKSRQFP